MHEAARVTADVRTFLEELQDALQHANAIDDFRTGWVQYLDTEMKEAGDCNPNSRSLSQRRARNMIPSQSDGDVKICLLSSVYQRYDVHLMVPCHACCR